MVNTATGGAFEFQSTLSVRRATVTADIIPFINPFQSTLSVRRATRPGANLELEILISIHALRKESDLKMVFNNSTQINFNPRSP